MASMLVDVSGTQEALLQILVVQDEGGVILVTIGRKRRAT